MLLLSAMMFVVNNEKRSTQQQEKEYRTEKNIPSEDEFLQSRILQLSPGMIFGAQGKNSQDSGFLTSF
jgi:hypothetical protein